MFCVFEDVTQIIISDISLYLMSNHSNVGWAFLLHSSLISFLINALWAISPSLTNHHYLQASKSPNHCPLSISPQRAQSCSVCRVIQWVAFDSPFSPSSSSSLSASRSSQRDWNESVALFCGYLWMTTNRTGQPNEERYVPEEDDWDEYRRTIHIIIVCASPLIGLDL